MSENPPKRRAASKTTKRTKSIERSALRKGKSLPVAATEASRAEAELERIAEILPPEEKKKLLLEFASHRGWLPPPAMMREYEAALPGLAERIVAMPEREQAHRHKYLDRETDRQFRIRRRGQDYALLSILIIIGFAAYLAYIGQSAWAARLVIATLVGIVGIFVTGKWFDSKAAKAEEDEDE